MSQAVKFESVDTLPRTPASDVKKLGWRGVMRAVQRNGRVVVTHHDRPEAVILSVEDYGAIVQALRQAEAGHESALDELRRRFDQRLQALQADDAGERLRSVMARPARLGSKVKAGTDH